MAWVEGDRRSGWRAKWREGGRRDGRRCVGPTRKLKAQAEADGEAAEAAIAAQKKARRLSGNADPEIPVLLRAWRDSRIAGGHCRQAYADEVIERVTVVAKRYRWSTVADITLPAIERWQQERRARRTLAGLQSVLRWAVRTHAMPIDPRVTAYQPGRRDEQEQPELLTDDQVRFVLERAATFGPNIAFLVEHLVTYGRRPIDLCRLEVRDWRRPRITYRDTKAGGSQAHDVPAAHADRIDQLVAGRAAGEPIFLRPQGDGWPLNKRGKAKPLGTWYRWHIGRHIPGATGAQCGIYVLKDVACTRLMQIYRGDRRRVAIFTGHSPKSLHVLDRYVGMNDTIAAGAVADLGAALGGGTTGGTFDAQGDSGLTVSWGEVRISWDSGVDLPQDSQG